MKVLLINPKIAGGRPWIPIGLLYIASYLRKHHIDVKIIDSNFVSITKDSLPSILGDYKPEIIATGGMTVQSRDALRIGGLIKSIIPDVLLVYGGVHFTFMPHEGLYYGDVCVIGEGEKTILDLAQGRDFQQINGVAYKIAENQIVAKERSFIENLDDLPFPAYDLVDINKYGDHLIVGSHAISIMTGRGCPYNCVFCASPQFWKRRVRFHSIGYVMEHVDFLIKNYGLRNLRIMDDVFTVNKQRVFDFCDGIERHGFQLNMDCLTHAKNSDYEMFKRMKEVGFSRIGFGVESGDNYVLKLVNKGITTEDVRNAVMTAKKAGLDVELLFMIGNIGETKETIISSHNLAKELSCHVWSQFATPFPGSVFYDVAEQYGEVLTKDWNQYHHQEPVFIPNGLDKDTMIKLRF